MKQDEMKTMYKIYHYGNFEIKKIQVLKETAKSVKIWTEKGNVHESKITLHTSIHETESDALTFVIDMLTEKHSELQNQAYEVFKQLGQLMEKRAEL